MGKGQNEAAKPWSIRTQSERSVINDMATKGKKRSAEVSPVLAYFNIVEPVVEGKNVQCHLHVFGTKRMYVRLSDAVHSEARSGTLLPHLDNKRHHEYTQSIESSTRSARGMKDW